MTAPGFAFTHPGLDRAEHFRQDPRSLDAFWAAAHVLVLNEKNEACLYDGGALYYPAAWVSLQRPDYATFLGLSGEQAYFAVALEGVTHRSEATVNVRTAAVQWPALDATVFAQAKALLHWQTHTKYCGRCGGITDIKSAGYNAVCTDCGLVSYPQTHPATIMCVSDGEHLLLGRQAVWPEKRWSLLAGFVEPGESPEQTVIREVAEESGVLIQRVRYVASQPWPMPMALMLGFDAYAPMQPIVPSEELQAARWVSRAQLQAEVASGELLLPDTLSISHHLIMRWLLRNADAHDFWHTNG